MDHVTALRRATDEFGRRLAVVSADDWSRPTPADEWDVHALVGHVIGGNVLSTRLVHGATREDAMAAMHAAAEGFDTDPLGRFAETAAAQIEAMTVPDLAERTVPHPAFDMPATLLLQFRIGDLALHGWDLARSIGADETLDPELVETLWASLEPMTPMMAASGVFGEGPSGTVPEDAPLQTRLLDLTGRRP